MHYSRGRSARTVRAYTDALDKLGEFLGKRDFKTATVDDLTALPGIWPHKQGLVGISRRPIIASVRGFYAWLAQQGVIAVNPAQEVNYPKTGLKLPRVITLSNAERMLWASNFHKLKGVRDAAILALMMGCGLRVNDVVEHVATADDRLRGREAQGRTARFERQSEAHGAGAARSRADRAPVPRA
ncbi:site-specific integrase [Burkholderia theae]|uniref:site-specific integrase n=1 Tax=Burkholderia theae TaxID=3143496 RepID=UPI003AFB2D48